MASTYKPNDKHQVTVELNTENGLIHLYVLDVRTTAFVDRDCSRALFNKAMDILKENDHIFAINMINNLVEDQ